MTGQLQRRKGQSWQRMMVKEMDFSAADKKDYFIAAEEFLTFPRMRPDSEVKAIAACQWMRDGMPDHTIEDIYILSGILKGRFFLSGYLHPPSFGR